MKAKRKPSLDRLEGETDDDYFMRVLPKPPIGDERDDVVAEWLDDIMRTGGSLALQWAVEPINWPLSSPSRGRMLYYVNVLLERANEDAKRQAQAAAREQQAQQVDERQQRRRAAGWS